MKTHVNFKRIYLSSDLVKKTKIKKWSDTLNRIEVGAIVHTKKRDAMFYVKRRYLISSVDKCESMMHLKP